MAFGWWKYAPKAGPAGMTQESLFASWGIGDFPYVNQGETGCRNQRIPDSRKFAICYDDIQIYWILMEGVCYG